MREGGMEALHWETHDYLKKRRGSRPCRISNMSMEQIVLASWLMYNSISGNAPRPVLTCHFKQLGL